MLERCTDDLDMANQLQDQANEQARARRRVASEQEVKAFVQALKDGAFDGVHCVKDDCGVPLPELRLEMFKMVCTDCARAAEEKQKRIGR